MSRHKGRLVGHRQKSTITRDYKGCETIHRPLENLKRLPVVPVRRLTRRTLTWSVCATDLSLSLGGDRSLRVRLNIKPTSTISGCESSVVFRAYCHIITSSVEIVSRYKHV